MPRPKPMSAGEFAGREWWCPICRRGKMLLRDNRKKGTTFYGCSNYPSCTWTEEDPESPDAGDDIEDSERDHFRWDRDD